ncbi:hypothetical protein D9Q98_000514 [Chlorella vulgaris]|uniref:FAD/NAD(P)-binding domain-containing protein n=1 Tax=Chlorella vulgaris TaxID=3077 RepID=A0A9D4TYJ2_CHLVU|nr:hypothetical protein D9Q98_000514 [Chlorella vulgaris]
MACALALARFGVAHTNQRQQQHCKLRSIAVLGAVLPRAHPCGSVLVDPKQSARHASRSFWRCRSAQHHAEGTAAQDPEDTREHQKATVCIIGGGPAAHTAAIYLARAEMQPVLFEGWMANGLAPGGQLTTTTYIENFPGFPQPILGGDLCDNFRQQSINYGTTIYTETVSKIDLRHGPPFRIETEERVVDADTVIVATGAAAKKLRIGNIDQFWNMGISACAVCDGSSPLFRNHPVAVIGGGDVAMEEALFLARYASKVYIVHRFDHLESSVVMARRAMAHPKIEVVWQHEALEAFGKEDGTLAGIRIRDRRNGEVSDLAVNGLFFAIGHAPATAFLDGQVELDSGGYIVTPPGSTATSVPGVFAAGDVMDRKWRQAITSAGAGCIASMEAQHFLQARQESGAATLVPAVALDAAWAAQVKAATAAAEQQGSGDEAAPATAGPVSS